MANYCFASAEGRHDLFTEASLRGWVAAVRDFPRLKPHEESIAMAILEGDALRLEVCCISTEDAYRQLINTAWVNFYKPSKPASERQMVVMASSLKDMPIAEALALMRRSLSSEEVRAIIDDTYAQFLAATAG